MAIQSPPASLTELPRRRGPRYREAAYSAIKEAILAGKIEAGDALIEERIASALGISRTPVREALAILEHEGLLAPRAGRGLFIRELSREDYLDLFKANEAIEPYLARNAAVNATEADIEHLGQTIDIGRAAVASLNVYESLRSGREFHRVLGETAGNASLTQLVVRNEEQVDLYLLSLGNAHILTGDNMEASNREHDAILTAIRERDPEAAGRLVIYHAQSLRQRHAHFFHSQPHGEEAARRTLSNRS